MAADIASDQTVVRPADRWRGFLRDREVPPGIRERAPEKAWSLEPERFRWRPDDEASRGERPSLRRAFEALPEGGSVLDVGVGGGGSSLGLASKAGSITGVDRLEAMLESFEASARAVGVASRTVLGAWPDVAPRVEPADVAVCHHAVYGVAELEDFLAVLTTHARRRVVIEISTHFPQARLLPLWRSFHGVDRANPPVADEVQAVAVAMGFAVEREDAVVPPRMPDVTPESVAFARRRLYVGPERDPEIAEFLQALGPEGHHVVALWWPGAAS